MINVVHIQFDEDTTWENVCYQMELASNGIDTGLIPHKFNSLATLMEELVETNSRRSFTEGYSNADLSWQVTNQFVGVDYTSTSATSLTLSLKMLDSDFKTIEGGYLTIGLPDDRVNANGNGYTGITKEFYPYLVRRNGDESITIDGITVDGVTLPTPTWVREQAFAFKAQANVEKILTVKGFIRHPNAKGVFILDEKTIYRQNGNQYLYLDLSGERADRFEGDLYEVLVYLAGEKKRKARSDRRRRTFIKEEIPNYLAEDYEEGEVDYELE